MNTMTELTHEECHQVGGGWLVSFTLSYFASKAMDSYAAWVQGGAGGWTVEFNPDGYRDPLL
ncbi:hypothetical protein [Alteromonas sp. CYL-A6]|uniref:hypothetical protein n=1 Tax=Alteromonas nitratireducens TaxID=3390813 RepID=UPI0034ACE89F